MKVNFCFVLIRMLREVDFIDLHEGNDFRLSSIEAKYEKLRNKYNFNET